MGYGFFRPTKYKLLVFILIATVLFYIPTVPTYVMPLVKLDLSQKASHWQLVSAVESSNIMNSIDTNTYSFGLFSGTEAGVLNILYILMIGYILACILLYGFHKIHG